LTKPFMSTASHDQSQPQSATQTRQDIQVRVAVTVGINPPLHS
jgi:hypothetical protein